MSIANEISRIQEARDTLRAKAVLWALACRPTTLHSSRQSMTELLTVERLMPR